MLRVFDKKHTAEGLTPHGYGHKRGVT